MSSQNRDILETLQPKVQQAVAFSNEQKTSAGWYCCTCDDYDPSECCSCDSQCHCDNYQTVDGDDD